MIIIVGSLFTIAFTFLVGLSCGGVEWFIDVPSFLAIILPIIFFLCTTKSGGVIGGYIKTSFKKNHEYSAAEFEIIATCSNNAVKFTLAAGWFGFFLGLIVMLVNIDNPVQIGPSLSVSLITLLYAIAISYFVFFPLKAWAENKSRIR